MSYYCRICPRIIEEDDIDLCPRCIEGLCEHCHGEGVEPDAGTDSNPEPRCHVCQGACIDETRQAEIRAMLKALPSASDDAGQPCAG